MIYYTDGSTYPTNPANGGAGFVVVGKTKNYIENSYLGNPITNNYAETAAVLDALLFALEYKDNDIVIMSDSAYVGFGLNRILSKRKLLGTNLFLWEQIKKVVMDNHLRVQVKHIAGHSGHRENELADALAGLGAKNVLKKGFIQKEQMDELCKELKRANKSKA